MKKQPEPIRLDIPVIDGSVMYSMMPINDLMKLRWFIDDLIKWKAAGNPVYIMALEYEIKEKKSSATPFLQQKRP